MNNKCSTLVYSHLISDHKQSEINHWKFLEILTFRVVVTQRRRPHVTQAECAFAAAVDKCVALVRVELYGSYHLG